MKYRIPIMLLALFWTLLIVGTAIGQDDAAPVPANHPRYRTYISVESEVPDAAKLETRAIDILQAEGMTRADARAFLRAEGDSVRRSLAVIYPHQLRQVSQAIVTASVTATPDPSAPLDEPVLP